MIEVAQKGVLGAYLFIVFAFTCQYGQLVGVCSGRLKKGVLCADTVLGAGPARKRGVLCMGQVKKGGSLPRHIPILNIYVSAPPPPPPPGYKLSQLCTLCLVFYPSDVQANYIKPCYYYYYRYHILHKKSRNRGI